MVGYSRLIELDDAGTLQRLRALRDNLIDPAIEEHGGRIVQTGGDSLLITFHNLDGAMRCAVKVQQRVPVLDGDQPPERAILFRVGIDIGDAIADRTGLHGDVVNVAARLQAECPPGGICVSRAVRDHVHGRLDLAFEELGRLHLKNIARPVDAFVVRGNAAKMPHGVKDARSRSDKPLVEPAAVYPNNLPQLANALIGRERDVAEIEGLLFKHRLVTLVGTAGAGKTSLSLRVGSDLLARFPDGTWFVGLAPLDRAELVGEAVAAVFGLPVLGERPATDAIAAFLRSRRVFLILDNCEHLIRAAAEFADTVLKTCPSVFILATSREALSVPGEHAYQVPLLDVPPRSTNLTAGAAMGHSAIQLFVERAAAALGRYSLTDKTAPIIAEICRRLDGIPLAIELAAPRLKMLTHELLQTRLDDQLHLLTGGSRTAAPRQQTLRAAVEWSYALLSEPEQAMLRRLGVFAGSFTLEAVAAVAKTDPMEPSDVFDVVAGLVDKSLVVSLARADENRYRMLESTRAFAREKLGAGCYAALSRRLCEHMTLVFERAEQTWLTTPRADWLAAHEPDLDNLRAAMACSLRPDGDPALGVNLVSRTDWLWRELALVQEQRRWFELALRFVDAATPPSVEARIRLGLGWDLYGGDRGRLQHSLHAIELLRQVGGEPILLGQALTQAAMSSARYRDIAEAERYQDEALSLLRRCGCTKWLAMALLNAGTIRKFVGDCKAARALVEEARSLSKALGNGYLHLRDHCDAQLASIAFEAGRMAEAIERARAAVEASRRHGTLTAELLAVHWLAAFLILDDQIEPGYAVALRALELSRAFGNVGLPRSIYHLALVLAAQGETDTAARL
ncbi:MAG: adenylate/guanylate cyclase domain-containing protein, partial [Alphaproteobacteria bacterium]|nr:adenylate/guanylate cyclase domain-containing protein [Alphaproteobacteria bacterium]